jgi:hypothetical protein
MLEKITGTNNNEIILKTNKLSFFNFLTNGIEESNIKMNQEFHARQAEKAGE